MKIAILKYCSGVFCTIKKADILLLFFVFVLKHNIVFGQDIYVKIDGIVMANQNIHLPYANVRLMRDSVLLHMTSCDSLGKFSFSLKLPGDTGLYVLASYLGASSKPYFIEGIYSDIRLTIDESKNQLPEVVISSDKPIFQRKADRFIFLPNKAISQGSSALDMIKHVPLLYYDERSEDFSIINKAGTVIYINNNKTRIPKEMLLQMLRSLPAGDIRNIEIITNPGSEYDANTTGGIININIKRQLYEGWLGNLALQTMQSKFNTSILNGGINYRKGKLALQLIPFINNSFNYYTSNTFLDYYETNREQISSTHHRKYSVLGGGINADYDINSKNFISFRYWRSNVYGSSHTNILTNYTKPSHSLADSIVRSLSEANDFYIYNFGNLNYHYNLDSLGKSYFDFNIDFNRFFQRRSTSGSFDNLDENANLLQEIGSYRNNLPQNFNNLSERVEFGKQISGSFRFNSGIQFSNTYVDNDLKYYNKINGDYLPDNSLSNDYKYKEKYWAFFVNLNKEFSTQWNAAFGFRIESTYFSTQEILSNIRRDSSYINFFPSLSISYSPNPKNQFGFSFSRKIDRPNIELLFPGRVYINPNNFTQNNPFLQPSLFYNFDLSYVFNNKYAIDLSYSAAGNSYSDFLVPIVENNGIKYKQTYLNYGTAKKLSLVINASQFLFGEFWQILFTPCLNYVQYIGDVNPTHIYIKNFNFNLTYDNYFFLSRKKNWTAFLTFKYFGARKDISRSVLNTTTSLDFEVKKVIKKYTFYLIISDIYNGTSIIKENYFSNYLLSRNNSETNNYSRSILLKIRYSFGNSQLRGNKDRNTANEDIRSRANR